jgi:hypothetical protein
VYNEPAVRRVLAKYGVATESWKNGVDNLVTQPELPVKRQRDERNEGLPYSEEPKYRPRSRSRSPKREGNSLPTPRRDYDRSDAQDEQAPPPPASVHVVDIAPLHRILFNNASNPPEVSYEPELDRDATELGVWPIEETKYCAGEKSRYAAVALLTTSNCSRLIIWGPQDVSPDVEVDGRGKCN